MAVQDLWHLKNPPAGAEPCGEHGKLVASGRHNRGKRWRVNYTLPNGDPDSRAFDLKGDAERFLTKVKADVARGEYIDPAAGKVTLRQRAEQWLDSRTLDPSTRESVARRLRLHVYPKLGDHELRTLAQRPSLIQDWLKSLKAAGMAANSIRVVYVNLSSVLAAALDDGQIVRNPCRVKSVDSPKTARPKKVIPWPHDRVTGVREAMPLRYQPLVDAAAGAGLRQAEVFGLASDDIDWLRRVIHVRRQVKVINSRLVFALPKREKEREVPLTEALSLRLAAHLERFPARPVTLPWSEPGGEPHTARLFFTTRQAGALNRTYYNTYVWKPALIAVGVPPTREHGFHQLRHYFASTMVAELVDIQVLAEWLGHEDPAFTMRVYAHPTKPGQDRARRAAEVALTGAEPQTVPNLYRVR